MSSSTSSYVQSSTLLQLPDEILSIILGFLSYNEIATLRIVCLRFNEVCKRLLNHGFRAVEQFHMKCQKEVKSQLPRRESERRDHPLAHHCNILSGIETRLSLLNMTFFKYVDARLCCFIPGKVIDEIYRVLRFVQSTKKLFLNSITVSHEDWNDLLKDVRANVILKELRDISSMAMEHFEEKILPSLKTPSNTPLLSFYNPIPSSSSPSSSPHFSSVSPLITLAQDLCNSVSPRGIPVLSEHLTHMGSLKMFSKHNKTLISSLKRQMTTMQNKLNESNRKVCEQEQVILELNRVLTEQTSKLAEHQNKFAEMNGKLLSNERKISAILKLISPSNSHSISSSGSLSPDDMKDLNDVLFASSSSSEVKAVEDKDECLTKPSVIPNYSSVNSLDINLDNKPRGRSSPKKRVPSRKRKAPTQDSSSVPASSSDRTRPKRIR